MFRVLGLMFRVSGLGDLVKGLGHAGWWDLLWLVFGGCAWEVRIDFLMFVLLGFCQAWPRRPLNPKS